MTGVGVAATVIIVLEAAVATNQIGVATTTGRAVADTVIAETTRSVQQGVLTNQAFFIVSLKSDPMFAFRGRFTLQNELPEYSK